VGFLLFTHRRKRNQFMKTKTKKLLTRFAPETRYELVPVPAVPFRGTCETELERYKNRLLREALQATSRVELYAPLRRAANDAAAVAWMTPFPLLFLPALFEEKVRVAQKQFARQESVRQRSRTLLEEVV
jgi:hypothetical protein